MSSSSQLQFLDPQSHHFVGLFQLPLFGIHHARLLHVSLQSPDVVHTRLQNGTFVLSEVPAAGKKISGCGFRWSHWSDAGSNIPSSLILSLILNLLRRSTAERDRDVDRGE